MGVNIEQNYLLSTQTIAGGDSLSVLGRDFNRLSEITKVLNENAITLFYESSSLTSLETKFQVQPLVSSLPVVIPVRDLKTYQVEIQDKKPIKTSLAMVSEGTFEGVDHAGHDHHDHGGGEEESDPKFKAVIFGDSDFMSDVYFETGFNKDLVLNTFAFLTGLDNLISIRPRVAENTKLILTTANSAFVLIFPVLIPLVLLLSTVVLWFRRRGA